MKNVWMNDYNLLVLQWYVSFQLERCVFSVPVIDVVVITVFLRFSLGLPVSFFCFCFFFFYFFPSFSFVFSFVLGKRRRESACDGRVEETQLCAASAFELSSSVSVCCLFVQEQKPGGSVNVATVGIVFQQQQRRSRGQGRRVCCGTECGGSRTCSRTLRHCGSADFAQQRCDQGQGEHRELREEPSLGGRAAQRSHVPILDRHYHTKGGNAASVFSLGLFLLNATTFQRR